MSELTKDEQAAVEAAIQAGQDWLLESDEMKAAVPSRKARLFLLHPLRLGIQSNFRFRRLARTQNTPDSQKD